MNDHVITMHNILVATEQPDNKWECMLCMIDAFLSGSLEATIIPEHDLDAHILTHTESTEWRGWDFYRDFYSTGKH